ncbi:DEAD/DEAH box helicase family protein [Faecalicatena sp. AGMB00832]|uniref:DEAD/DEAH box helicase family protein n=1 Tax=Faecalicatena faecalis TaxID=2726362 RepID=A0ABS6D541_9FIRM|nr:MULTISPECIES: DEAD/DEAH box helicase family protein [Faecalicatena]MBU3876578.1 DEAD/DEAH box helicase family protein [Faecalicatena faecalis]MCI6464620.1 DEAD/DEAH box helicase family protein [Faecalicatena sp.]MDY5618197.1 DEAD/DEAH box helicase family protein [Lachnospiraceae bacterium]
MGKLNYNEHYFEMANPYIYNNSELREPQIQGYYKVYEHFVVRNKKRIHAIVVLPTGVGKTGLMGLLPFHICEGRVLIITPQLTIKDTVVDSLDPDNPESFWYRRKIFNRVDETPTLVEFERGIKNEILDVANIVILNIHKLQARLSSSPLNYLPKDYFDMIIIDEAHHSTANTWVETINHFDKAKVVKLTGTPIRTDGVELAGELVYKYKLSQAMAKGYVKSLRNIEYVPEQLLLTIDKDEAKQYTVEQLLELGLRDEDWIRRSVAYSRECSKSVVIESIKLLEHKRSGGSKVPHKIIAVACSIDHAEQIKQLYVELGYRAEVIHSRKTLEEQNKIKQDIENHRLDVIIHVAMLGEGYDHPYLSVAAIFRPFKNELPYEQFIGRVLRVIPEEEVEKPDDNIADVVSHHNLKLAELWDKYKRELQESEVIKHLQAENLLDDSESSGGGTQGVKVDNIPLGLAEEQGTGTLTTDLYLNTELIKRQKEEEQRQKESINKLQELLHIDYEQALSIYNQTRTKDTAAFKRPDLYFANRKKSLDDEIREILVPQLVTRFHINQAAKNLADCRLFSGRKYMWIKEKASDNGALLAMYFNTYLRNEIGKKREDWKVSDYDIAFEKLSIAEEFVEKVLIEYLNIDSEEY